MSEFTENATLVLNHALQGARELGHGYVGTEHLLLGLTQTDGIAGGVLAENGINAEKVIEKIRRAGKKSGCWSLFLPALLKLVCVCGGKAWREIYCAFSSQPQESHDGISSPFLIASRTAL